MLVRILMELEVLRGRISQLYEEAQDTTCDEIHCNSSWIVNYTWLNELI